MESSKTKTHCCKYQTLLQTVRNRICTTLSLPTVNAATLYKRITPTDETSNEFEEKTAGEIDSENFEADSQIETNAKSELQLEIEKYAAQDAQMTGWQRIKQAYQSDYKYEYSSAEYLDFSITLVASFALGFTYGGVPALRLGKKRYIQKSQAVAYETKFHAVSESYNAASRGLIRYGFRWGWRVAFVASSFQLISTCLSLYRNQNDLLNYGIAAGSTGAMYRVNLGLRGMVGGSVAGLVVGLPAGMTLLFLNKLAGESSLERARRLRAEYMLDFKATLDASREMHAEAFEIMDKKLKVLEQQTNEDTNR